MFVKPDACILLRALDCFQPVPDIALVSSASDYTFNKEGKNGLVGEWVCLLAF